MYFFYVSTYIYTSISYIIATDTTGRGMPQDSKTSNTIPVANFESNFESMRLRLEKRYNSIKGLQDSIEEERIYVTGLLSKLYLVSILADIPIEHYKDSNLKRTYLQEALGCLQRERGVQSSEEAGKIWRAESLNHFFGRSQEEVLKNTTQKEHTIKTMFQEVSDAATMTTLATQQQKHSFKNYLDNFL